MMEAILSQFWIQRLGWTLLHFLWQGTAIAAVYAGVRGLMSRSLSARGRYVLACMALGAMAATPPVTFLLLSQGREAMPGGLPAIHWSLTASASERFLSAFVIFWLAGVLALSMRLFGGWRFTNRLISTAHPAPAEWQETLRRIGAQMDSLLAGTKRPVRLLVSSLVDVPTVLGWLRPTILIPVQALTGLPTDYLTALLAHEMAHIYRQDYFASILQSLAETVLFYHPAIWWISEQIRSAREACCDDLAVAVSGDVVTYVRALAELESQQEPRLRMALTANGASLIERIRRLISPMQPAPDNLPGAGAAWAMALLWLAGVGMTAVHAAPVPVPSGTSLNAGNRTVDLSSWPSPLPVPQSTANVLTGHARNAVLFDPFLTAQAQQTTTQSAVRDNPASPWNQWLNADVTYIITAEERSAFLQLSSDEEREQFAERFWQRRDPTPGTVENEYKEEHYRRIGYANEHFGWSLAGWKTDRGHAYISYGPPNEIESHPAGSAAPAEEDWRYRFIEGFGNNVQLRFLDAAGTGEFKVTAESGDPLQPRPSNFRFQDLALQIDSPSAANKLPMAVRMDYFRGTDSSTLVNITAQFANRDLQFQTANGIDKAVVNMFGRITSMTRRPITTFEPTLQVSAPSAMAVQRMMQIYQQSVPLQPGRYRLDIVAKDVASGNLSRSEMAMEVPHFDEGKLTASSLVIADAIEKVPVRPPGVAMFTIGDSKVRPRVGKTFTNGEKMGIYLQVYNFTPDSTTQKPSGAIDYEIDRAGSNLKIVSTAELVDAVPNASASQVTVQKLFPLGILGPGSYTLRVTVTDRIGNQSVQRTENFEVTAE